MMFEEDVARMLVKGTKLPIHEILLLFEIPPDSSMGHIAFPCYTLAKEWKKAPAQIAETLATQIDIQSPVVKVQSQGPYLNFFFDRSLVAEKVLLTKTTNYPKRKERVMVEHSNGNTHKSVHIGHLRNLFLGDSLVRILRSAGYSVVNTYYINDTGAMVARCLWALLHRHAGQTPPKEKLAWLGNMYAEGSIVVKDHPEVKEEIDVILQRLEAQDKEITKIWKETRQWSIEDWHRIFEEVKMLPFDAQFYDSEVVKNVAPIIERLHRDGVLKKSDGAIIADLEQYDLGVVVVVKSDGTLTYIAKDFALAERKFKEYEIDKSVYVVASEQELHFQQLFKILELGGFEQAKKCYHLSYGLVMLSSGKLSSREGTAPSYDGFSKEMREKALGEVQKRHADWTEKKQVSTAHAIALAAMRLPMIAQDPIKRIVFDVEKSLDFEGETGPYLQYSYARLCSVLRKHGKKVVDRIDFTLLCSPEEQKLLWLLGQEHETVVDAAEKYKPSIVARYALDLAQAANTFYHAAPILKEKDDIKKARLLLVTKTKEAIGRVIVLLGIPLLDEM